MFVPLIATDKRRNKRETYMNIYEFITIIIALASIIVSVVLTRRSIESSNRSTRLLSRVMRENSRMTSSEHLSLYRIEAFYNAVAIKNLEFDIQAVKQKLAADTEDKGDLETKLQQLQMNLHFMKIREAQLLQNDFTLQKDLRELYKELEIK
jgi:hypothetical protein